VQAPTAAATVLCDRSGKGVIRRFATLDGAWDFAEHTRPCGPACQRVHLLLVCAGHRVVGGGPGAGSGYKPKTIPVFRVEIFDHNRWLGLADELSKLYPPRWRLDGSRRAPECDPSPQYWPMAGDGLNAPLGPYAPG
jgi:hypothetical protein